MIVPCENLVEHDPVGCAVGRKFPEDCHSECPRYGPGINQAERTRCEVWSRVMGYHRPVSAYNPGKQQEHRDRKMFVESPPCAQ